MEVCFACHGVQHGPQGELATSECAKCHTKSFDLTPKSHDPKDYAEKPHADEAKKSGVNDCMMCHNAPKDCDECHEKKNLELPKMPNTYVNILYDRPMPPSVKIYPEEPTSMAQCSYCHPDLDAITPGRLIFAHGAHLQRNYECTVCHPKFGHYRERPAHARHAVVLSLPRAGARSAGARRRRGLREVPSQGLRPRAEEPHAAVHEGQAQGARRARARSTAACATSRSSAWTATPARARRPTPRPSRSSRRTTRTRAGSRPHGKLFLAEEGSCGACHDGPVVPAVPLHAGSAPAQLDREPPPAGGHHRRETATSATATARSARNATTAR